MLAVVETCTIYMVYDSNLGVMYKPLWRVSENGDIKTMGEFQTEVSTPMPYSLQRAEPFLLIINIFKYCLIVSYLLLYFFKLNLLRLAYTSVLNHISISDEKYLVLHSNKYKFNQPIFNTYDCM